MRESSRFYYYRRIKGHLVRETKCEEVEGLDMGTVVHLISS